MSSDWGTISPKRIRKKLVGVMTGGVGTGQEFAKELAVGWKQLDTQTVIKPNPFEFRPSKLPYCPVVALAESKIVETRWGEDSLIVVMPPTHYISVGCHLFLLVNISGATGSARHAILK
jgi:hypothetical protein